MDIHTADWEEIFFKSYMAKDEDCLQRFIVLLEDIDARVIQEVQAYAQSLILYLKEAPVDPLSSEGLLVNYNLNTQDGRALMEIAEAVLRISDKSTLSDFLSDKIIGKEWRIKKEKISGMEAFSRFGLSLASRFLSGYGESKNVMSYVSGPVIRGLIVRIIKTMGSSFVFGETMDKAIQRMQSKQTKAWEAFSFDMLGEAARTEEEAQRFFANYMFAIETLQEHMKVDPSKKHGISIKLSALFARYEPLQEQWVFEVLYPRVLALAVRAKESELRFTIDAEEVSRLVLSLKIFKKLAYEPELKHWNDMGLVVQAYQKRALDVLEFLKILSKDTGRRFPVRLVKGAYWDMEVKISQQQGFENFPVYTRKVMTDISYLACTRFLLLNTAHFYPQFATHNAYTVAFVRSVALDLHIFNYEFQRLFGMGERLYDQICREHSVCITVYSPVGTYETLLPYLVRRLLENGANSSFVHEIHQRSSEDLSEYPLKKIQRYKTKHHSQIALPPCLYDVHFGGQGQKNSQGYYLDDCLFVDGLKKAMLNEMSLMHCIGTYDAKNKEGRIIQDVYNPATQEKIGSFQLPLEKDIQAAIERAHQGYSLWNKKSVEERAVCLEKVADIFEKRASYFAAFCCQEAGKTYGDIFSEIRESVDFCRYYAVMARKIIDSEGKVLAGWEGEKNTLFLLGRGVFFCVSPWNFPMAIFVGQIAAALVTGNSVLAKPAEQTSLIAHKIVESFHEAGVPKDVLIYLPGIGPEVGKVVLADSRIEGVCFTGSTKTAQGIQQSLLERGGAMIPFIAETGGQNCMIVDSSALIEQVTADVVRSVFHSAGQRCSALRVLYVQDNIADCLIKMIQGAGELLNIGNPVDPFIDVGPVIDKRAQETLLSHIHELDRCEESICHFKLKVPSSLKGTFVPPCMYEIKSITRLDTEYFGPILHVIRYKETDIEKVIHEINSTGYGLTCGIHSRIEKKVDFIAQRIKAGNIYINRDMIGAVVGVQPFGGEGLSGTGPKAGGPNYLLRFLKEKTVTVNLMASGGNMRLLSLSDELDFLIEN